MRGYFPQAAVAIALLFVLFAPIDTAAVELPLRFSIVIESNDDFTAANGVTHGSGTAADPFVIENHTIVYAGEHEAGAVVRIANTDAHVALRNLSLIPAGPNSQGFGYAIWVLYSSNVTIENNQAFVPWSGISVLHSDNLTVRENRLQGPPLNGGIGYSKFGVSIGGSTNVRVEDNLVDQFWSAVYVRLSRDVLVVNNTVTRTGAFGAVNVDESDQILVESNAIIGGGTNAFVIDSNRNTTVRNNVVRNLSGAALYLEGGSNLTIENNLFEHVSQGLDIGGAADLEIRCNSIHSVGSGGWIRTGDYSIHNNSWAAADSPLEVSPGVALRNNTFDGVSLTRFSKNGEVDAILNWWGSGTGPTSGQAGAGVIASPWLTAPPQGC